MEEIGEQLIPIVIKLADKINNLLTAFSTLSQETKETALGITLLVGAVGPILIVLGSLTTILAGISLVAIKVTAAIVALAVGIAFVVDNFEAFKERLTLDFLWNSIIMGVQMTLRAFGSLIDGYNKLIDEIGGEKLDFLKASNEFEKLALNLESAIIATGEYEHEFNEFGESMGNTIDKILPKFREFFKALQGGGGGKVTTKKTNLGPVVSDPTPFDPLKNILDSVNFLNKEDSLIKVPLFKKGYSVEVDEFSNLMGNIKSISDELNQSFQSFGNVIEGTFAQALQSSDGFFKSFLEGAKRALSALAAQIAATLFLNAVLGSFGIGQALGFKSIGGTTGIGQILGGLVGGGVDTNSVDVGGGLRSMMNTGGGVEVFGTISGADILLSSDRARNNRTRTRGY